MENLIKNCDTINKKLLENFQEVKSFQDGILKEHLICDISAMISENINIKKRLEKLGGE